MLKKHKTILYEVCKSSSLFLSQFHVVDVDNQVGFLIRIHNSPMVFEVRHSPNYYEKYRLRYTKFSPEYPYSDWISTLDTRSKDSTTDTYSLCISEVSQKLINWLENDVQDYLNEKELDDVWLQAQRGIAEFLPQVFLQSQTVNENFSADEVSKVEEAIEEFRHRVMVDLTPLEEQVAFINNRLDYLVDAVNRLNKFDWTGLAFSIITGIAINLNVDTGTGKKIFELFQQIFGSVKKLLAI